MTSTSARTADPSGTHIVHRGESTIGPFMLTLCRLIEPVSIRPPQSPRLKPFTFFTSRAREQEGGEQVYLHMGFFETLANAERWARVARARHPDAVATIAPPAFWLLSDSDSPHCGPVEPASLTDTQVMDILEMRHPAPAGNHDEARDARGIELLRPDDTGTRLALREAVARGAPVSFAVQLRWSARPIDPSGVPSLAPFKGYSVYAVESRRAARSCFFLRLGFFDDPVSAKEFASRVRSSFASAAVVPVLEEEVERAREACADTSLIPCLVQQQRPAEALDCGGLSGYATAASAEDSRHRGTSQGAETIEQTLAQLAEREMWNDTDTLSDTGVRHIKVEVQKRAAGRH